MQTDLNEDKVKAVRRAISGQDENPVTLQTSPGGGGVTGDVDQEVNSNPLRVSAHQIVGELAAHDPILLELMASRAALKAFSRGHESS